VSLEFLAALHFLTIWPVPLRADLPADIWGRSLAFFPLVGAVVGACLVVAQFVMGMFWPPVIVAAGLLVIWIVQTGALHLDGWADCCDGLLVARPPEERLRILKDTHIGAFGVVGVVALLLLKFACLQGLMAEPAQMRVALMLSPILSRWAMVCAAVVYPYGRPGRSLGAMFASHASRRSLWISTLLAASLSVLLAGWAGLASLILVGLFTVMVANWTLSRIPGLTGDVYGAINELAELSVLLVWAAS